MYDHIMQYAVDKPYTLKRKDMETITDIMKAVAKCVFKTIKNVDRNNLPPDTVDTILFCQKIVRLHESLMGVGVNPEINYRFEAWEIKKMLKILEGCCCCGDRFTCPYRWFKTNGLGEMTSRTKNRETRTINKLKKLVEEINEHDSNEMSNLGS